MHAANGPVVGIDTIFLDVVDDSCWALVGQQPLEFYLGMNLIDFDNNGNLWSGGTSGMARYNDTDWTVLDQSNSDIISPVNGLAIGQGSDVWLATDSGLILYDGTYWTRYDSLNSTLAAGIVTAVSFDNQANLWVGTNDGAFRMSGTNFVQSSAGLPDSYVLQLKKGNDGKLYALTNHTQLGQTDLSVLESGVWHPISALNTWLNNYSMQITNFAIDNSGNIWMGFGYDNYGPNAGVVKYNGSGLEQWENANFTTNHFIKSLSNSIISEDNTHSSIKRVGCREHIY